LQDNLAKQIPVEQTILDFNDARDKVAVAPQVSTYVPEMLVILGTSL